MNRFHFGPLVTAGTLMGIGMGGFVDGILFHQILQLHNMLSARIPVKDLVTAKTNMVWDGFFHAGVWIVSFLGLAMLLRAGAKRDVPWSPGVFWGAWLTGWGLFNLVEGLIDHQILGLHHVLEYAAPETQAIADYAFLGCGALLILIGMAIMRAAKASWVGGATRKLGAGAPP